MAGLEEEERATLTQRQLSRESLDDARDAEIEDLIHAAREQFPNWDQRLEAAAEMARIRQFDANEARHARDRERHALAENHPETCRRL